MPMCRGSRLKLFITLSCVRRPRAALLPQLLGCLEDGQDCRNQGIRDPAIASRRRMEGVGAHQALVGDELRPNGSDDVDEAHPRPPTSPPRGPPAPARRCTDPTTAPYPSTASISG